jgi:hypothetical protein
MAGSREWIFQPDFKDLIALLNQHGVVYLA